MPLYEYECESCGKRFELIRKLLSSPAIHFKGTGWYITDYARKNAPSSDGGKAKNGEAAKSETKGETKSETKSDAKSEAKSDSSPAASEK